MTRLAARKVINVLLAAVDSQLPALAAACRTSVTPGPANRGDNAGDGPRSDSSTGTRIWSLLPRAACIRHQDASLSLRPSLVQDHWAQKREPARCSMESRSERQRSPQPDVIDLTGPTKEPAIWAWTRAGRGGHTRLGSFRGKRPKMPSHRLGSPPATAVPHHRQVRLRGESPT